MAAVELHSTTRQDVTIATEVARWFGASMLCLHVVGAVSAPAWLVPDRGAHDRIRILEAQQQLDRLVTATRTDVRVDTGVVCGQPAHEIAVAAAAEQIQLVVTALRDRPGWFGARRGSVSYDVLAHTATPVLAYPPRWRPQ